MTSRAADQRAYRRRQKAGTRTWPLLADSVAMEEALVENGWLAANDTDDRRKVLAAFRQAHMQIVVLPRDVQRHGSEGRCIVGASQLDEDDTEQ